MAGRINVDSYSTKPLQYNIRNLSFSDPKKNDTFNNQQKRGLTIKIQQNTKTLIILFSLVCVSSLCIARESIDEIRTKALKGNAVAQFQLGTVYCYGVPPNYNEAFKWFKKAADQGLDEAQNSLGVMYHFGWSTPQNDVEAFKWFKKAADQKLDEAQFNLGSTYYFGNGVPQDYVEAVKWCKKAADQGLYKAQFFLGIAYENGHGVQKDDIEAFKWYKKAADQGYDKAQFYLGMMYKNGNLIQEGDIEAFRWFKKAADQGHDEAQFILGLMYFIGIGVPENYVNAFVYLSVAAALNNKNAREYILNLTPKMTPTQVAEGQKQAEILWENIKKERLSHKQLQIQQRLSRANVITSDLSEGINTKACSNWEFLINDPEISESAMSPDEVYRLTVKESGEIELSNNNTGQIKVLYSKSHTGCGSLGCRDGERRALFTSDGKYAIATSSFRGGPTLIWETKTWTQLQFEEDEFYGGYFSVSYNNQYVALVGYSWVDGLHLFLIDLVSRKVIDISEINLPKEIAQKAEIEESNWFDKISNERRMAFYNFNFSKDSKYLIIHKNNEEFISYDISNKIFSFCRSVDAKVKNDLFEILKRSFEGRIEIENITEASEEIDYCCDFDSKSPEIILAYNLIEEFKKALISDNRELVTNFIFYPIRIHIDDKKKTFYLPSDLMNAYDKVFDNDLKKFVSKASYRCFVCEGIMMGSGEIWFNFSGKIIAINK